MSLGFPKSDLTKRKIWDYKVKCSSFYTPCAGGGGGGEGRREETSGDAFQIYQLWYMHLLPLLSILSLWIIKHLKKKTTKPDFFKSNATRSGITEGCKGMSKV